MKIVLKDDLADQWCRLNDKESFYNNSNNKYWTKERVEGAMKMIENFVEEKKLKDAWKKYHKKRRSMIRLQKKILGA